MYKIIANWIEQAKELPPKVTLLTKIYKTHLCEFEMRKLIIIFFASSLMLSCSEETEEMIDKASDAAGEMAEEAMHKADDAADAVTQMADEDMNGPQVEPLPDWDSLPPIEEEMASEDKANKMIDKANEDVKEIAEEGTSKAEEMVEEDEEMIKKE